MKRFEVVITCIPRSGLLAFNPYLKPAPWILGQYRWRWAARLSAFTFNTSPAARLPWLSFASVRPILRAVATPGLAA